MIRTAARKAFLLAALTLSVGAVAVNCSHRDSTDGPSAAIGSVGLAITLPSGATVSTVHYSIKNGSNVEVSSGNINTSDPGATVSSASPFARKLKKAAASALAWRVAPDTYRKPSDLPSTVHCSART